MPRTDCGHDVTATLALFAPPTPNERLSGYLARLRNQTRRSTTTPDDEARPDLYPTTSEASR